MQCEAVVGTLRGFIGHLHGRGYGLWQRHRCRGAWGVGKTPVIQVHLLGDLCFQWHVPPHPLPERPGAGRRAGQLPERCDQPPAQKSDGNASRDSARPRIIAVSCQLWVRSHENLHASPNSRRQRPLSPLYPRESTPKPRQLTLYAALASSQHGPLFQLSAEYH